MRRKLFFIAIAMISGITAAWVSMAIAAVFGLCTVLLFVFFRWQNAKQYNNVCFAFVLSFLVGMLLMAQAQHSIRTNPLNKFEGKAVRHKGIITEIQRFDDEKYKIICTIAGKKVLLSYFHKIGNPNDLYGRHISFLAELAKPPKAGNPRTFDYALYLKTKKVYHVAVIDHFDIGKEDSTAIDKVVRYILTAREGFIEGLTWGRQGKSLARGVLFGDTKSLDEETYDEFKINGTAHVLAVSGLHVGMLYGLYKKLMKRKKSLLLTLGFILILLTYGTAALWAVSVTRAVLLILVMVLGDILDRRYDMITGLGAAAMIVMVLNPYAIMGAGFQMSFLAVMSMGFFEPVLHRIIGPFFAVAISVQLGLMPYMIYTFNYISLIGVLCNIPIVFLISLFVPLGVISYFIFMLTGAFLPLAGSFLGGLGDMIIKVNHILAVDGVFSLEVPSPPLWVICLIYGLVFLIVSEFFQVYFWRKDWKTLFVPILILTIATVAAAIWGASPFDRASMVFVDVGQGDCLHLKWNEEVLLDGGGNIRYNIGKKNLKPYFLRNGMGHVDLAAATHLHTDHYLGITQLAQCFPVKKVMIEGLSGGKIQVSPERWIDILWPEKRTDDVEDENENSMVFKVHDRGITVLVTGDITEEGELDLVNKYAGTDTLKADILKIAHHGSKYSTCDEFLRAVSPKIAVISVGKNNYGHPAKDVIVKLHKKGIMIFRTDISGAVGIINRRGKISVCTKNQ